ncbi:ubiquitin-associated domain-containing protein 1-like [Dysidea avara]|uniref:ubiquitin-associated domain-containing protein 1-like n=1 Tax=Dysidea avara TaxID=196820 RepID=UPI0033211406
MSQMEMTSVEQQMELSVIDVNGKMYPVVVDESCSVDDFRDRILPAMLNLGPLHGNLVLSSGKRLEGKKTLKEEGVNHNDHILFIPSRSKYDKKQTSSLHQKSPHLRAQFLTQSPSKDDIDKLTSGIPASVKERTGFAGGLSALLNDISFHRRMRDALICLVNTACKLQSVDDEDNSDDSDAEDSKQETFIDQAALDQLMEMGFTDHRAKKALLLNNMSCLQAMEWLIQHQNDSDIDDPISSSSTTKPSDTNNVSLQGETLLPLPAAIPQEGIASDSSTSSRKDKSKSDKPKKGVKRRKWEFVPDKAAIYKLKQMGFEESEIIDALAVCNNNESAACDWLLGDRIPGPESVDKGLSPDSQEYREIFKEPQVHLGLLSSRNLRILEDIIQNQPLLTQYLGDPELGPLLLHVARIVLDKPTSNTAVV